jgi:hypothetical protein
VAAGSSIMFPVLLAAFVLMILSPSQSSAANACRINSGLHAGKTGTYDTTSEPGHTWCCTGLAGTGDCTECGEGRCSDIRAKAPGGGSNKGPVAGGAKPPPSAGTNTGPSGGGKTGTHPIVGDPGSPSK